MKNKPFQFPSARPGKDSPRAWNPAQLVTSHLASVKLLKLAEAHSFPLENRINKATACSLSKIHEQCLLTQAALRSSPALWMLGIHALRCFRLCLHLFVLHLCFFPLFFSFFFKLHPSWVDLYPYSDDLFLHLLLRPYSTVWCWNTYCL